MVGRNLYLPVNGYSPESRFIVWSGFVSFFEHWTRHLGMSEEVLNKITFMRNNFRVIGQLGFIFSFALLVSSCQVVVNSMANKLSDDLASVILNSQDVQLIEDGVPTYLILIDALLESSPKNAKLYQSASLLNSSYATAFLDDQERQMLMANKALTYAFRGACLSNSRLCGLQSTSYDQLQEIVDSLGAKWVPTLYNLLVAWSAWIDVNQSDFRAIAQLPKVRLLVDRLLELDETYELGSPHMYVGVFESLLPAMMGGRPAVAKLHFERSIEISEGKNLYAKVLFAAQYARSQFDRELHDRLLNEVLHADPEVPGFTLQNRLAQAQAKQLLESADDYF